MLSFGNNNISIFQNKHTFKVSSWLAEFCQKKLLTEGRKYIFKKLAKSKEYFYINF